MTAKPPTRTLFDLRPNATIDCMVCEKTKPQPGSVKFHARHICFECATRLQAMKEKKK